MLENFLAIVETLSPLLVAFLSVYLSNRLVVYRVEQLEKKVEQHNNLVEKVTKLEASETAQWRWIDELKKEG